YLQAVERMMPGGAPESFDPHFYARLTEVRQRTAEFCKRTGIQDAGFIRPRAGLIELLDARGDRLTCRRPWDTVAIHANGDVHPCMAWTRPPTGNLATQSFEEIWNGERAAALRAEFDALQPGVDCQHCTIRKEAGGAVEEYDDFFFRMISKKAPQNEKADQR
ncbi:MAG TPA: SPASM domain-containing protein, partial [Thermoanaerobaculia bacterium]|nr:SPASM domain-containing protein [Thermoanaerobaculia bacterium]